MRRARRHRDRGRVDHAWPSWCADRLDDNGSSATDHETAAPATLVCVTELDAVCRALGQKHDDLTVRIEDEATTQQTLVAGVVRRRATHRSTRG